MVVKEKSERKKKGKKEEHVEGEKSIGTRSQKNQEEGRENLEECGKKSPGHIQDR